MPDGMDPARSVRNTMSVTIRAIIVKTAAAQKTLMAEKSRFFNFDMMTSRKICLPLEILARSIGRHQCESLKYAVAMISKTISLFEDDGDRFEKSPLRDALRKSSNVGDLKRKGMP